MLGGIDWLLIILYIVIIVILGLYFKKKGSKNTEEYFAGGKNLPWWLAGFSMVATTFAADTPLAVTEIIFKNGISGNWLWWNMLIGGMLTTFFFARLWRRTNVLTELEFISLRYSGKEAILLRGFKAIYIALIMNTLIIAWVNLAMMTILEVFFGIKGFYLLGLVFLLMFFSAIYTVSSGLRGVVVTDFVQFIIAMTGSIILALFVIKKSSIGSISNLVAQLPPSTLDFFPSFSQSSQIKTFSISIGAFLVYGLMQWWASWYPGAEPGGGGYIVQRMISTKNEKHAFASTLFFQIAHYALRPWPWIIVGLAAIVLYPELTEQNARYAYIYAIKDYLPSGLKGLMLIAIFSAYMSTISTQLNFGASILTNDFWQLIKKDTDTKQSVKVGKFITVLIMLISIFITSKINSISGIWQFMLQAGAGLGLVLILRWFWWRINSWSEISAMIAPFVYYGISKFIVKMQFPDSYFFTVTLTTITWLIVTYITKPTYRETLEKFYTQVKPFGFWKGFGGNSSGSVSLPWLFIGWLSSTGLVYCVLFTIGFLVLKKFIHLTWLLPTISVLAFFTIKSIKKNSLLQ